MKLKNILLIYKKSAYEIYFLKKRSSFIKSNTSINKYQLSRFKEAHREHIRSLIEIKKVLKEFKVKHKSYYRGRRINPCTKSDLVISVGGDGTFLETARKFSNCVVIGVNSSPTFSIGKLCQTNAKNFRKFIKMLLGDKLEEISLQRARIKFKDNRHSIDVLNDILIAHNNPAAMSRYCIQIKNTKEIQRSSGLWISTAAGSSGVIHSAGGKIMPIGAKSFQYLPRELYIGKRRKYKLKGGILNPDTKLRLTSLMRNGYIYVDGSHEKHPFPYGCCLEVFLSPKPLKTYKLHN